MAMTRIERKIGSIAMVAAVAIGVLIVTIGILFRGTPPSAIVALAPSPSVDPTIITTVLKDARFMALVPIAPPVVPAVLGNSAPFPGPRTRGTSR